MKRLVYVQNVKSDSVEKLNYGTPYKMFATIEIICDREGS